MDNYLVRTIKSNNMTQKSFAKLAGVTVGMVNHWTKERNAVTPEKAVDIEIKTGGTFKADKLNPSFFELLNKIGYKR